MRRLLVFAALLVVLGLAGCSLGDDQSRPPQLGARSGDDDASSKLGFPSTATKNTIRVGGGDATADAAGIASAIFPATSEANRPTAAVLVDDDDWQGAVTASVFTAAPIRAPILLTDGGDLPAITQDTLDRLKPRGSDLADDAQVIRIGRDTARPGGLRARVIEGGDAYERAAAVDRFYSAARGKPSARVIIASGERAEWTIPAAAWAAFSGDAVLLTTRNRLPDSTLKALRQHEKARIYILGPKSVISDAVERRLRREGRVRRIQAKTAVENAIAFAQFEDGEFGWNINIPGSTFSIANLNRPLDAAAAATLNARGIPSAMLLTDSANRLPRPVDFYLRNVQPGFEEPPGGGEGGTDPRDVAYSRVWVLGDDKAISVNQQARLDEITDLIQIEITPPRA